MAQWNSVNTSGSENQQYFYNNIPYDGRTFYSSMIPESYQYNVNGTSNLSTNSTHAVNQEPSVGNSSVNSNATTHFNSNLTATAKEFTPSSSTSTKYQNIAINETDNTQPNKNTGAFKKVFSRNKTYNKKQAYKRNEYCYNERYETNNTYSNRSESNKNSENVEFLNKNRSHFTNSQNGALHEENSLASANKNNFFENEVKGNKKNNYRGYNKNGDYRQKYKYDTSKNYNKFEFNYNNPSQKRNIKTYHEKVYYGDNCDERHSTTASSGFKNWRNSSRDSSITKRVDAGSQRERLEQMVIQKKLDCLVCCENIFSNQKIWSCKQCYHIFHFDCVVRWAESSLKSDNGWRCPACQNVNETVPEENLCYCGKVVNPRLKEGTLPHSCGDICHRTYRNCEHKCPIVCHPGPCPECTLTVLRTCSCGNTTAILKCSSNVDIKCPETCNKSLNCEIHSCKRICHSGSCKPCEEIIEQTCFCRKNERVVLCSEKVKGSREFQCGEKCNKLLSCGNHSCLELCHSGPCNPCALEPNQVLSCPCGQSQLNISRTSCLDPIECCDKVCKKVLKCGHECDKICHVGPCPDCTLTSSVRCRCGHMDMEISCKELISLGGDARCKKKCNKKLLCGKHRCKELCCIEQDHICGLPCNRQLPCGLHRCTLTCHSYRCPPCSVVSFEELFCECGENVIYPPVACGTRPPPCNKPCSRKRTCNHEVNHTCHTGACPPCTVLSVRWCHGQHEKRATIPCYQQDFSCGLPCRKNMPCGRHTCIQPCHKGTCQAPCNQPCTELRSSCGHPCNVSCHDPPCPETSCKQTVRVTCQCGLRASTRPCMELAGEYQSIAVAQLASKMAEMQNGHTVDISDIVSNQRKTGTLKTLECNEECRKVERNRRLAIGLQIRNPDLTAKLTPRYSDYMRTWAKRDARFCQNVHNKLSELVQLAKESKQKSRSYSFESMNRDKRHFIHEYCEHFGCESEAYDQEPNRNVVATAFRDKSWLPSVSLLELIQRENGQRKVPGPVMSKSGSSKSESVSLRLPGRMNRPPTPPIEYVDYFNNPPL